MLAMIVKKEFQGLRSTNCIKSCLLGKISKMELATPEPAYFLKEEFRHRHNADPIVEAALSSGCDAITCRGQGL